MTTPDPAAVLRRLDAEATPGRWEHTPGMLKDYVESDNADLRIAMQSMHPLDGRDVPSAANARLIATLRNAVLALAELIEAAGERVALGPDEGCETRWPHRSRPCTCGHDALSAALGKVREAIT